MSGGADERSRGRSGTRPDPAGPESPALAPVGGGHAGHEPTAARRRRPGAPAPEADARGAGAEALDEEIAARDHDAGVSQVTRLEQGLTRLPPG